MGLGHHPEFLRMDDFGRLDTPVHRLDARVKALATGTFVVVVMSFPRHEVSALMPFFLYPCVLMALGGIPPGFILRRLLVAAPFALGVGLFNPLLDRETATMIGDFPVSGGWLSFASIVVRFILTVSAALTLVAVTGIDRLCAGCERMGLPRALALQLQLLYRYLFVLAEEGTLLLRAVEARSAGRPVLGLRTYAALTGQLLLRTMDRAARVYTAMASRGFDGHVRILQPVNLRLADLAFLAGWTGVFIALRLWPLPEMLGQLLLAGGGG